MQTFEVGPQAIRRIQVPDARREAETHAATGEAIATGRHECLHRPGVLHLQRAAGNHSVAEALEERSPVYPVTGTVQAGNIAVARLLQSELRVQRDPPAPAPAAEQARIWALETSYIGSVVAGNWRQAALDLNGFNDTDIQAKVILLNHDQLINMDAAARKAMPGFWQRVVSFITAFDAEADRVGLLTYNYETALAARDYDQAISHLNGFNDTDIITKANQLSQTDKGAMLSAAKGHSSRMQRLMQSVVGVEVSTRENEQVGGTVYTVRGGYTWRITPDAIVIDVGMNFKPDSGVAVPVATWFGYITGTWNHFSAVNQANPSEKKRIDFNPFQGSGHDIQVSAGDGRANAGHYYAGDSRAAQSVPHEFGHLIGLQDEYERDANDFTSVTGQAPAAGSGETAKAQAIARGIHDALFLDSPWYELHRSHERREMRAVEVVLAANHIVPMYQAGRSALTAEVAKQYRALYGVEMSAHFMDRIDTDNAEFNDWREQVLGTFQYTSTSIMGDMSDHVHPVEGRHVRAFAGYVKQALARDTWLPQQDH